MTSTCSTPTPWRTRPGLVEKVHRAVRCSDLRPGPGSGGASRARRSGLRGAQHPFWFHQRGSHRRQDVDLRGARHLPPQCREPAHHRPANRQRSTEEPPQEAVQPDARGDGRAPGRPPRPRCSAHEAETTRSAGSEPPHVDHVVPVEHRLERSRTPTTSDGGPPEVCGEGLINGARHVSRGRSQLEVEDQWHVVAVARPDAASRHPAFVVADLEAAHSGQERAVREAEVDVERLELSSEMEVRR